VCVQLGRDGGKVPRSPGQFQMQQECQKSSRRTGNRNLVLGVTNAK
jgi:hypothetical protein